MQELPSFPSPLPSLPSVLLLPSWLKPPCGILTWQSRTGCQVGSDASRYSVRLCCRLVTMESQPLTGLGSSGDFRTLCRCAKPRSPHNLLPCAARRLSWADQAGRPAKICVPLDLCSFNPANTTLTLSECFGTGLYYTAGSVLLSDAVMSLRLFGSSVRRHQSPLPLATLVRKMTTTRKSIGLHCAEKEAQYTPPPPPKPLKPWNL